MRRWRLGAASIALAPEGVGSGQIPLPEHRRGGGRCGGSVVLPELQEGRAPRCVGRHDAFHEGHVRAACGDDAPAQGDDAVGSTP